MEVQLDLNSVDDYRTFLKIKALPRYEFVGRTAIVPDEFAGRLGLAVPRSEDGQYRPIAGLFDYQRDIAALAIRKRKFAVFAECGLGKSLIMFEFARHAAAVLGTGRRVLIVTPLMVVGQAIREVARFYGDSLPVERVSAADLPAWVESEGGAIGITNFEAMTDRVKQGRLGCLIVDECFAPGTLVDRLDSSRNTVATPIENIIPGDTIINASGVDKVLSVSRREVPYAVHVQVGTGITCSPNHPFFTRRGWVCAQDLEPGDSICLAGTAVRVVQGDLSACQGRDGEVLRSILLSEMEDESPGSQVELSDHRIEVQEGEDLLRMGPVQRSQGGRSDGPDCGLESHRRSKGPGENLPPVAGHESRTFRAWGEWSRVDGTSVDADGCIGQRMDSGVCLVAGPAGSRLSLELQARLGESRTASRYRGGWVLPCGGSEEDAGPEEGGQVGFARVEGLEVYEPGDSRLDRFRDASGKLYFYDLEAERHPSFSVNGLLVHNSSTMKSAYGKWGQRIIELGKGLDWKLALTGTPAPNDRIEFANHAVFLDACPTVNSFLARFFINRGQTDNRWELKPHALGPFYRALSDWCIFLTNPGTYGWKDNAESIPPINVQIHDVELTADQTSKIRALTGDMFGLDIGGIVGRGKIARIAKGGDSIKPAFIRDLIASWPDESTIVWCRFNDEQERIARELPGCGSIEGKTPMAQRERIIEDFQAGRIKVLVSKASVLGFGLNLQVATRHVFSSLHDSWEEFHQAVKRSNRVGSTVPLNVHVPITEAERPMVETVLRKARRIEEDTAEQERIFKGAML